MNFEPKMKRSSLLRIKSLARKWGGIEEPE
jgi:hypothetical protein